MSKILFLFTFLPLVSFAQENPYDLLDTLDPAAAPKEMDRVPASVAEEGQISVRKKLPDAKLQKTARTLQWEVLNRASGSDDESDEQ